jgi:hypothetical protein
MRVISYGGGVQSTALVVLACQGKIGHVDAALFANVGDDSEHPDTLRYVREVITPWAGKRGLPVYELGRVVGGESRTLLEEALSVKLKSMPIPAFIPGSGPGRRSCTRQYKVDVVMKWLREHGVTRFKPADVLIGFSSEEFLRIGGKPLPLEQLDYPLMDLRLSRHDCKELIACAGLAVPHKSACFFCPFHRKSEWAKMKRDTPQLFDRAAEIERELNKKRDRLGKPHVYLTRFGKPLDDAIQAEQPGLDFGELGSEGCDDGYCWT